jgi:U3 small nucleolar RNA-associated protein 10
MKADKYILRFICDLTANAVDEHVSFKTLFSFYAATLIAYIKREDALDENVMLTLMPHLLKGVRASKVPEYQIATYMILSQLAVKVQFGAEALMELLGEMTTYYNSKFFEHYLLATVHLAQVQENFTSFPEKSYNALAIAKNFDQALLGICSKYSADAYIRPLLFNLIESAFKHRDRVDLLSSLLNNDFHTKETIVFVCNKMMDEYLKYVNDDGDTKAFVETVSPALQTLSQRHFEALDSALNTRFKQLSQKKTESSKEAANHLYKFSNLAFHGTGHEVIKETNTTLYLSLQSPSATIRLLAVKKLVSISDDEVNSLKQVSHPEFYVCLSDSIS